MIPSNDTTDLYILLMNGLYLMYFGASAHGVHGAVHKHCRDGRSLYIGIVLHSYLASK